MHGLERQRLEHEHFERALDQLRPRVRHNVVPSGNLKEREYDDFFRLSTEAGLCRGFSVKWWPASMTEAFVAKSATTVVVKAGDH
jgi:hypothetical protein